MKDIANLLMAQARGTALHSTQNTMRNLELIRYRVGLWPLVSQQSPEVAMGVMTLLAFLLERWQEIIVYRIFFKLDDDFSESDWSIAESQFSVDDWQIDGLDENIAIWGNLDRRGGGWELSLQIENDLLETDETFNFQYTANDLTQLVAQLPAIAEELAGKLGAKTLQLYPAYNSTLNTDPSSLLKLLFHWERKLQSVLFDIEWNEQQFQSDYQSLLNTAQLADTDVGEWLLAHTVARAMQPTTEIIAKRLAEPARDLPEVFSKTSVPAILIANALFQNEFEQEAYDVLEARLTLDIANPDLRLVLASLYRTGRKIPETVRILQEAIDSEIAHARLYATYADLVNVLSRNNVVLPRFVCIDETARTTENMQREVVAAYEASLKADPGNAEVLQAKILAQFEGDDTQLWEDFKTLVELDKTGEHVRLVIEALEILEDVEPGIKVLRAVSAQNPQRADLHINLASMLLLNGDEESAEKHLERAEKLTDDPAQLAEIDRLWLSVDDPEFDAHLGEIIDLIDAGKSLNRDDIDFLEETLEAAPSFAEAYLLLAKAYLAENNQGAALETLLDGQQELSENADITELLAKVLWQSNEREMAFDYLNKGLANNPDHVPLLSLTGRYLFDDGQPEEARIFLNRAESLNPMHPALKEVIRYIASRSN